MAKLSVIVPFVGEYPQVLFTLQSIHQECQGIDHQVVAIDNFCEQVAKQGFIDNKSGEAVEASTRVNPWLKYVKYYDKLSHWNAKRYGIEKSDSEYLLFVDAHCIVGKGSIKGMLDYLESRDPMEGTIHLPLTYKILESRKLIYKFVCDDRYYYTYSFTPFRESDHPYEVPVMSTCGMMMSRMLYEHVGGWPKELGIYGGGENFMNYTLSVLGKRKMIYPKGILFHHGEKRDYHYEYNDMVRNRMIAHYLFGGMKVLEGFTRIAKGNEQVLNLLKEGVIRSCDKHRTWIKERQVMTINEWAIKRATLF